MLRAFQSLYTPAIHPTNIEFLSKEFLYRRCDPITEVLSVNFTMNTYWIFLTLIWTVFHQRETSAASLRSESLDLNPEGASALQHGSNQPVEQNYYMKRSENLNRKTRLPYDRRQIYTSKTYFGRNQLPDLQRKFWNSKKGDESASFRLTHRYRSPVKQSRLNPHDYMLSVNHEHVPHINMEMPQESEYIAKPDDSIVQILSDNYDPNRDAFERTQYGKTPEHNINQKYENNPQYNTRGGYGSNPQPNVNYNWDQAPAFYSNSNYAQFPKFNGRPYSERQAEQTQENGYLQDPRYGNNYDYGSQIDIAEEFDGNSNFRQGQNVPRYGNAQDKAYDFDVENGRDHKSVLSSSETNRDYVNHEHQLEVGNNAVRVDHYGRPVNFENTHDSQQNIRSMEKQKATINLESKENQKYLTTEHSKIMADSNQILKTSKNKSKDLTENSEITSTVSDSETISDETLAKEEIFRFLSNKNLFKQQTLSTPVSNDLGGTFDTFSENLEGSGSIENSNEFLPISDVESTKSARILEIFSRNFTVECMTPKNESGHCAGLTECPLLETMENFSSFLQYMCLQKSRLVGICCPDNPVVEVSDSQENSTEKVKVDIQQPPDGCGISTHTRIVGGTMSVPHEFSWMVALLRRGRFYCGGVIINNWYILTAAHCILGIKISDLKVRLGEFDFHQRTDHQMDIPVSEIKRHALFVTLTFQHDIALLKLKRRIEYTKFIGSICLPKKEEGDFTSTNATVVGWGTVSFGGAASPVLRKVTVPVWDNKKCDDTYVFERITDAFMCAGSSENGEDACQGDSGGPLMSMNGDGRWSVIGIVSWGRRCGDPSYPGVYTRVTSYLDWIAENAQ
ncbi:hypothetical protein JTE90_016788 [Oedothorax gibbosus]|uniref:Peptidase S1 domain-containing protein n=1 Tax=Oedothorax gibbosus TaxID=931172 RepID=A0AAV6VXI1_9ARAC|nr:hypothetical protein JTE90_016788 [Oedothorax gibbosus]